MIVGLDGSIVGVGSSFGVVSLKNCWREFGSVIRIVSGSPPSVRLLP